MSSILKRLADVARSYIQTDDPEDTPNRHGRPIHTGREGGGIPDEDFSSSTHQAHSHGRQAQTDDGGTPHQVVKDLATFGLAPPSSLKAVKAARNREIKKYHSDKFINDPERLETSKEIMQIYNAAYDRLKAFYRE